MNEENKEKIFKIIKNSDKLKKFSKNRLFITEKELKRHLTENEILELLKKGILDDKTLT